MSVASLQKLAPCRSAAEAGVSTNANNLLAKAEDRAGKEGQSQIPRAVHVEREDSERILTLTLFAIYGCLKKSGPPLISRALQLALCFRAGLHLLRDGGFHLVVIGIRLR